MITVVGQGQVRSEVHTATKRFPHNRTSQNHEPFHHHTCLSGNFPDTPSQQQHNCRAPPPDDVHIIGWFDASLYVFVPVKASMQAWFFYLFCASYQWRLSWVFEDVIWTSTHQQAQIDACVHEPWFRNMGFYAHMPRTHSAIVCSCCFYCTTIEDCTHFYHEACDGIECLVLKSFWRSCNIICTQKLHQHVSCYPWTLLLSH